MEKIVIIAGILNIVLPMLLAPFATPEEIKPKNGAESLDFRGQFMHMMVHHNQTMITSTLIIMFMVYASVLISKYI